MAEAKTSRTAPQMESARDTAHSIARQEQSRRGLARWEPFGGPSFGGPFELFDRMTDEMDRAFDRVFRGFGLARRWQHANAFAGPVAIEGLWAPRVEAFQEGDRFVVRAELPGVKKEDVQVELRDDALIIHGERREERNEEREGYYHSEREYGQFHRTIPLPEGAIAETAKASFRNGVLEVAMQSAPSGGGRGRRLEIMEESGSGSQKP
jgi:HSP20 family protein